MLYEILSVLNLQILTPSAFVTYLPANISNFPRVDSIIGEYF